MAAESSDLSLIEKCPKEKLSKIIHGFLDQICHVGAIGFQEYNIIWNVSEWKLLVASWVSCLKSFVQSNLTQGQISKQLDEYGISKDTQKIVMDCLQPRKDDLILAFMDETCALSQAKLNDFDWKLKLIMASDKLANIRQPVVSLDLDIEEKQEKKQVSVELSKDELKELITSLEAANRVVMQLKT